MALLNDGLTAGTAGATGAANATRATGSSTSVATGVMGAGAGSTGASGATANTGPALPEDATGATGAPGSGTTTVVASTGEGIEDAPGATGTSTATVAMVGTTTAGTARTTGKSRQEYPDETQEIISLPALKANLYKELYKTPTYEQRRLAAQSHALLLQDSPVIIQLNDAENNLFVGIINIPKSSTIRVLHSFEVRTNPFRRIFPHRWKDSISCGLWILC